MLHRSRLPPAMVSDPRREKKLPSLLREQRFASDNRCDSVYWLLPPVGPVLRSSPESIQLPSRAAPHQPLGGRLSVDFLNVTLSNEELTWERLILFLETARIVSAERGAQLLDLPQSDLQAAEALLSKARRVGLALRRAFAAMLRKQRIAGEWVEPINEILRITEGHDELVSQQGVWELEFIAREGGLDWLLAAVARSARRSSRRAATRPFGSAPIPTVASFFMTSHARIAAAGAPWPFVEIATKLPLLRANTPLPATHNRRRFIFARFAYFGDSPFDQGS